ncbi:(5-formylfuran-3-yl)methyl phosphate synthase [Methyloceanibacter sp.]|uniref:(5-formylfuran-3-yl)methyl phosphate synthase n=1 Tax=Methyloceanibacter sp. TaxID=1965321 RepID=UPI002D469610|nr:(5-formylfuran-3-yl)methyl phosphate synthase [Methyloceanibacter sp.]HZP10116.1 (5-formylfuran-3-yl)methyl phosphate synthase [Methyloceanibacter sp.]
MTRFLASVRDAGEASLALHAGADIVDLKDPAKGALGALAPEAIAKCIAAVAARAEVSATAGDLPMDPEIVRAAVLNTAAAGVDYVKLGLFPGGDPEVCLDLLAELTQAVRVILVIFADAAPRFDALHKAAAIGATGVMLDTARKDGSSLRDHMPFERIADFVAEARARGLLVGLAGALQAPDVPRLLPLKPDLIGFRGALCRNGARGARLDAGACAAIRALIPQEERGFATAAAPRLAPSLC